MTKYKFKGYTITNCGYHQPDHCVWWEAVDENGEACFHGKTLREVEFMILDHEWEQKMRKKEEEIELLKASKQPGNAAAMREALVAVKKSIDGIGASSLDCDPEILMMSLTLVCARLSSRIERALSAPQRNCGVGTAEEQSQMPYEE